MFDFPYSVRWQTESASPLVVASALALGLLYVIAAWRIFKKADEPGWASIVPLYNQYILFKISWGSGWMFLLLLVPLVNIVVGIMTSFKLATAFGKGTGFGFGLLLLPGIFHLILGFGDAQYEGPA